MNVMQGKRQSRVLDMTKGSPLRLLLAFALPVFLGNLLQQFYNLADTSIAGHMLGDAALAQIGATAALYSLITMFAFGLNNGLALSVSRWFGSGDREKMRQSVGWMVILSTLSALLLAVVFLAFRRPLLYALHTPEDTMAGALSYITVILMGIPLTMAYNTEAGLLRAVGNSIVPLIFLVFSSILNVILDILFLGPLGFGVQGAAVATVLAQGISAVIGFFYILRNHPELCFKWEELRVSAEFVWDMFSTGISMAMMSAIFSIGSVILQSSINALGNVYIAAQVGGRRLVELFSMTGEALGASMATYASQNYGAGKRKRIAKGAKIACIMYLVWWFAALYFAIFLAPAAVRLVTGSSDPLVIENAVLYIRISIPSFPPMGFLVVIRNTLQGIRHRIAPLLCSIMELIGKVIFSFWIVPVFGYTAVCVCEPFTWVICFVFISAALFRARDDFKDQGAGLEMEQRGRAMRRRTSGGSNQKEETGGDKCIS